MTSHGHERQMQMAREREAPRAQNLRGGQVVKCVKGIREAETRELEIRRCNS